MGEDTEKPVVVCVGRERIVEFAVCSDESVPARDFFESLNQTYQGKLITSFKAIAEIGIIKNPQRFKHLDGSICEFKQFQVRVFCFREGNRWILTHGIDNKKDDKLDQKEISRAKSIMADHLKREAAKKKGNKG